MDYEHDLKYTQDLRKKWIEDMTKNGNEMPRDFKTGSILNMILDGMDRSTLTMKKIRSDEGMNDKNNKVMEVLAGVMNKVSSNELLKLNETGEKGTPKFLDVTTIENFQVVEGELDIIPHKLNYDEFMSEDKK